jgi:hypothetical protein
MAAPTNQFDIVKAAEALLESAKALAAAAEAGNLSNPDEENLRRTLGTAARKMAYETLPPPDLAKSEWVVAADLTACNILMEWKAFDLIPLHGSISIADLALALNAQESLIGTFFP